VGAVDLGGLAVVSVLRLVLDNIRQRLTEWQDRRAETARGTESLLARINAKWER
jgi:hypothetical protein